MFNVPTIWSATARQSLCKCFCIQDLAMQRVKQLSMFSVRRDEHRDHGRFSPENDYTLYRGRGEDLLKQITGRQAQLFVTSPPYNIGKRYEKRVSLDDYIADQDNIIGKCIERLSDSGSICWQVGNHIQDGAVIPLDIMLYPLFAKRGLTLRNRIIWHFEHGLHCSRRLSGRHETILWFTWPGNNYTFALDPIRVPQKYPGKRYYKGPKSGQYSANPLGKNPGDVWIIPNVKHNHVEKTSHPCQFPVELVERLVLALTRPGDLVVDPYMGSGSTAVAALLHERRVAGADVVEDFIEIAEQRIHETLAGSIRTRPREREVYKPQGRLAENPFLPSP
ncbi:MAG TPA: site-specific DNA-methyltransferase [Dongiaceae bacterium]|nr:site-specific DNA-methyltransferase [Dongiaceae bacterium]